MRAAAVHPYSKLVHALTTLSLRLKFAARGTADGTSAVMSTILHGGQEQRRILMLSNLAASNSCPGLVYLRLPPGADVSGQPDQLGLRLLHQSLVLPKLR